MHLINVLFCLALCVSGGAFAALLNSNVRRTVDLSTHVVSVTVQQTILNTGSETVNSITLAHDEQLEDHLSFASAKVQGSSQSLVMEGNTVVVSIAPQESIVLDVLFVYTHSLKPLPASITQAEQQFVLFKGNLFYSTPYDTDTQTTTVKLASGKLESYTKVTPVDASGKATIVYGPYANIAGNAAQELFVHSENNSPFLTTTRLVRAIELSHWGNIAVTETVDLIHSGATLKDGFSRLDFTRAPKGHALSAVRQFTARLPAAARDVYYRDVIGNVSSSNLRASHSQEEDDAVEVEMRPRFPLMGGWHTHHTLGYNLPAHELLSRSGSTYRLAVRFVDHLYANMVVDEAVVRVVLPEGVADVQYRLPFSADVSHEVEATYLDIAGRPVLVFKKNNLVKEHMQDIVITYTFSSILLLREPLMVAAFVLASLAAIILINRIDFSLDRSEAAATQKRALIQTHIDELQAIEEQLVSQARHAVAADSDPAAQKKAAAVVKSLSKEAVDIHEKILTIDQHHKTTFADLKREYDRRYALLEDLTKNPKSSKAKEELSAVEEKTKQLLEKIAA